MSKKKKKNSSSNNEVEEHQLIKEEKQSESVNSSKKEEKQPSIGKESPKEVEKKSGIKDETKSHKESKEELTEEKSSNKVVESSKEKSQIKTSEKKNNKKVTSDTKNDKKDKSEKKPKAKLEETTKAQEEQSLEEKTTSKKEQNEKSPKDKGKSSSSEDSKENKDEVSKEELKQESLSITDESIKETSNIESKNDKEQVVEKKETSSKPENQSAKPQKIKKKRSKGIVILIMILILIFIFLCTIGAILIKNFILDDFTTNVSTSDSLKTKDSYISFSANITSNRPILNIYYAVDPEDKDNKELYQEISSTGNFLDKKVEINKLGIPVGKREVCFYVETLLGVHSTSCLDAKYDIGYISNFEENDIITIDSTNDIKVVSNEILVLFNDDISESKAKEVIEENGGEIIGVLYFANLYQVKVSGANKSSLASALNKFASLSDVASVSYNTIIEGKVTIDTDGYDYENEYSESELNDNIKNGSTSNLDIINATAAHELMQGKGQKINVGVIDAPINYNHDDLNLNLKNVYYNETEDYPTYRSLIEETQKNTQATHSSHGSNVASIAFAKINNGTGINGINDNVNLFYTNAWYYNDNLQTNENTSDFFLLYNISILAMSDCKVINMSLGDQKDEGIDKDSYKNELNIFNYTFKKLDKAGKNFLIVHSAGNGNANGIGQDARKHEVFTYLFTESEYAKKHVITVGAINSFAQNDQLLKSWYNTELDHAIPPVYTLTSFSNYGDSVDIFAPGTRIWGLCATTNSYCMMQGTSQAAPHVSGVASLIYSLYPDMSAEEVKEIIINSSNKYVSNHGSVGKVLDAGAAVKMALDNNDDYTSTEDLHYGYLQGTIKNADTDEYISSAVVYLTDTNDSEIYYISSFEDGVYDFIITPGTYDMHVVSEGYVDEYIYNIEVTEDIITYNVSLKMANNNSEKGTAKGTIIDAFDGNHIPEATMKIYRGINNSGEGEPVTTITSDSNGNYEVTLDPGNYTAIVTKDEYLQNKSTITIVSSKTKSNQNCSLTPILKEGEIRVILTWGATPSDLDSHLVGPTPDGKKFHIFYSNKNYNYNSTLYDNLDLDDTSSYGPETTSVYVGVNGTYTYYVHDFSNRGSSNSSKLANSNAQVKLYIWNKEEPIVYNVPNLEGTLWKVFSINNGEITVYNEMSYVNNPNNVGNN